MQSKREHRGPEDTRVAVLDALCDRREEGMTVFELRSHVEADIDDLETALADLKRDSLIVADAGEERTVIKPTARVASGPVSEEPTDEDSFLGWLRRKVGL